MQDKQELQNWMKSMLPKDQEYLNQSSAAYLREIQKLESILRPLWGVLPDYFSGDHDIAILAKISDLQRIVNDNDLPKITTNNRQIAVELGVLGYLLGTYKKQFLQLFDEKVKKI